MKQNTMINELKKKVFWSILIGAGGVLFIILLALNIVSGVRTFRQADAVLKNAEQLLPDAGDRKGPKVRPGRDSDRFELLQSVSSGDLAILELDDSGRITGATDPDTATSFSEIVTYALEKEDAYGTRSGWRYYLKERPVYTYLILLNTTPLKIEVLETAGWSLLAFLAAAALFALCAAFLTKRIVNPVEQAVTAQKRFIADASHELKTPLTVIDANAAVLEKSIGTSQWLDYIKEQTSRMAALVTELLTLSRLDETEDAGALPEKEPFDAAEVLMESVLPFESAAYEQSLTLTTHAPDALFMTGSREDFRQITGILLDNALKHAKAGGEIVLTLQNGILKRARKEEAACELRVSNTGETIPQEALPHLFERFYKADASRTHTGNSFGLGLAIAKAITDKQKGSITVTSENGRTEFAVLLPRG